MPRPQMYEVDIDAETIQLGGEWVGRQTLADRIKKMIEGQDFRISSVGNALEFLENAIGNARTLEVKLVEADAVRLDRYAARAGIKAPAFVRQAIQAYLSAQPPLEEDQGPVAGAGQSASVMTTITTEPATPGEEATAVELTDRKTSEVSKVIIDPSIDKPAAKAGPETVDDGWFKKT